VRRKLSWTSHQSTRRHSITDVLIATTRQRKVPSNRRHPFARRMLSWTSRHNVLVVRTSPGPDVWCPAGCETTPGPINARYPIIAEFSLDVCVHSVIAEAQPVVLGLATHVSNASSRKTSTYVGPHAITRRRGGSRVAPRRAVLIAATQVSNANSRWCRLLRVANIMDVTPSTRRRRLAQPACRAQCRYKPPAAPQAPLDADAPSRVASSHWTRNPCGASLARAQLTRACHAECCYSW
jgi:hypothetical protein